VHVCIHNYKIIVQEGKIGPLEVTYVTVIFIETIILEERVTIYPGHNLRFCFSLSLCDIVIGSMREFGSLFITIYPQYLVQSGHSEKISSARVNEGIRTPS
jgi:hypothetical protein